MANFYVDPINGNDANNGTTWALARKTMTATGWQAFPALSGDSTIMVAKTPDPISVGSTTFTNGSKVVLLNDPVVTTIFDGYGDYNQQIMTLNRNTPIVSTTSFIFSNGNNKPIIAKAYAITAGSTDQNGTLIPSSTMSFQGSMMVGATTGTSLNINGAPRQYLVMKISNRQGATIAVGYNNSNPTGTGNTSGTTLGQTNVPVQLSFGNVANRNVTYGKVLYSTSATEMTGSTDTVIFDTSSLVGETYLKSISVFTNGSQTNMTIDEVYWVTNLVLPGQLSDNTFNTLGRVQGGGLNLVIGAQPTRTMMQVASFGMLSSTVDSARGPAKIAAYMTFNWGFETVTLTGRMAQTYHINYNTFLSAGSSGGLFLTVKGGINKDTDVQDGVTRLSDVFQTETGTSPGAHNFELYLRNGAISGFSMHNFAQGLRLKLNNTRINENYNFEDIQGNNYGYYIYSDDGTCPSKVYIHYKNFGPNNALLTDTTMAACGGWSANLTKGFSSVTSSSATSFSLTIVGAPPIAMDWSVNVNSSAAFSPKFIKPFRWSSSATSAFSQTSMKRNRGMVFTAASTTTVTDKLMKATKRPWTVVSNTSSTTYKLTKLISPKFTASATTTAAFGYPQIDKGFAWNAPLTSSTAMRMTTNIPFDWSTGTTSSEVFAINRDRGYTWSSPMTVTYSESARVARTARFTSASTSAVVPRLNKAVTRSFSSTTTSSVVETVPVQRGMSALIQVVSSGVVGLLRATKLSKFTSSNTVNVSETLMRARKVTMPVNVSSTITTTMQRGKVVSFITSAATSVTGKFKRTINPNWSSTNTTPIYFDQGKMIRWGVVASVANLFNIKRTRGASWTAQELVNTSWGVSANRRNTMANVSAVTSSSFALKRDRGMFFTVPMYSYITQDIDLKSRTNSVITAHPVVSISLTRSNNRGFEVLGQTGSYMTVRMNKGMNYHVGEYVTIDGQLLKDTHVEQEGFGATSESNFVFGIGRGVQHSSVTTSDLMVSMTRQITLGWGVKQNSSMGVSSTPNRLDAFYVEYEAPVTSSLKDGSIIMGQRKTYSSGILHDARPVFDIVIHPAPTYTITLYEEVFA